MENQKIPIPKAPYTESYRVKYERLLEQKRKEREKELRRQERKDPEKILREVIRSIERNYELARDFFKEPKHIKILKVIIFIIPLLVISYLVYANFLVSHNFRYFYDIGEEKESGEKAMVLSPLARVSDRAYEEQSYRNLTSSLVYFDVPVPRGSENIKVKIRFKDNFPEGSVLRLGAKDKAEWHYKYKTAYNKAFEKLGFQNTILAENFNFSILPENSVVATELELVPEQNVIENYMPKEIMINTSLRGRHSFYVYAKGTLDIEVKKQDINWYNGSDEFEIELYDVENTLIASTIIPDDGITISNKSEIVIQTGFLKAENLKQGVYKLEFSNFDGLVRQIKINQNKIVANGYVFLADSNVYFSGIEKPSELYFNTKRPAEISFQTWHNTGIQTINVSSLNKNKTYEVNISERVNASIFYSNEVGEASEYKISSGKNDIIVSAPVYFAFSEESYFEPFKQRVVFVRNNATWLKNNADYFVVGYKNAIKDKENSEWFIGKVEFNIKKDNLYVKDNKLSMLFNVPHLSRNETENYKIPIDWIDITISKKGIINR